MLMGHRPQLRGFSIHYGKVPSHNQRAAGEAGPVVQPKKAMEDPNTPKDRRIRSASEVYEVNTLIAVSSKHRDPIIPCRKGDVHLFRSRCGSGNVYPTLELGRLGQQGPF